MERAAKARAVPLDGDEEAAWRAIARAVLVIPRTLDADLLAGCGLSVAGAGPRTGGMAVASSEQRPRGGATGGASVP
jgi:hypothetical protein